MSARYIPLPDENYMPTPERCMTGANTATTNKQALQAQWEIKEFANAVGKIIADKFPRTWELFEKSK